MSKLNGLTCRECGRHYPAGPHHVCEFTGNGLKTPDALADRLGADVTIRPALSAFDRAMADLESRITPAEHEI